MAHPRFTNIILFGPPGVGKGAQALFLSQRFSLVHLSTGEVIREEIKNGSLLGLQVQDAVDKGELADDETVLGIIMRRIDLPEFRRGFVLDGFPRTINQAEKLDVLLAERDRKVDCALFLNAPRKVVLERLAGRRICESCGATYHKHFKRPRIQGVCDICGGHVVQRHDDAESVHETRLSAYEENTRPLVEYYRRKGVFFEINANQPIREVAAEAARVVAHPED